MNIAHISYTFPNTFSSIQSLAKKGEITQVDSVIFEKLMGLKNVPRDNSTTYLLLLNTVFKKFCNEKKINKKTIKYVIFLHTSDETDVENQSALCNFIQENELKHSIYFGLSSHNCASVMQALILSKTLLKGIEIDEYILLMLADVTFTSIMQYIPGSTVLGDAASLVLLRKSYSQHYCLDILLNEVGIFSKGIYGCKQSMLLFQKNYIRYVCDLILSILEKNKLTLDKIKLIIPHNVNIISWNAISQKLSIPLSKIYLDNIAKIGHCFGSDSFINLKECLLKNKLSPGDYYLIITAGLGAVFSAMLMQY